MIENKIKIIIKIYVDFGVIIVPVFIMNIKISKYKHIIVNKKNSKQNLKEINYENQKIYFNFKWIFLKNKIRKIKKYNKLSNKKIIKKMKIKYKHKIF